MLNAYENSFGLYTMFTPIKKCVDGIELFFKNAYSVSDEPCKDGPLVKCKQAAPFRRPKN